jgi:hypothetical protein
MMMYGPRRVMGAPIACLLGDFKCRWAVKRNGALEGGSHSFAWTGSDVTSP